MSIESTPAVPTSQTTVTQDNNGAPTLASDVPFLSLRAGTVLVKTVAPPDFNSEGHFCNHTGKLDLSSSHLRKWALERPADGDVGFVDVELAEIPLDEWVRRASELGMHPAMGALLTTFARDGEVEFPAVKKGIENV
ncbi:hypothetical protein F4859DRAFT_517330 [Xylaria cf. heliscus]|nr:hypothetical protein F4859DRAFT_517330 [Xylaria cf. heliscus]